MYSGEFQNLAKVLQRSCKAFSNIITQNITCLHRIVIDYITARFLFTLFYPFLFPSHLANLI